MASRKVALVATAVLFSALMACIPLPQDVVPGEDATEAPTPPVRTATPTETRVSTATPTYTPAVGPEETTTPVPALREICQGGAKTVVLIPDPALQTGIRGGLDSFEMDLCGEGHAVVERLSDFGSPEEVRSFLAGLYTSEGGQLVGAILVGDIPYAYQYVTMVYSNPDIPPLEEEAISFQYYADLDGAFEASAGYTSPGGHPYSYDVHSGAVDWEIWIGVLPLYKGDYALTVDALTRYLEKNHAFRTGASTVPHGFLEINEHFHASGVEEHQSLMGGLLDGQYAWTPLSNTAVSYIYFDSPPGGLSVAQGYQQLSAGVADIAVGDAHGFWGAHGSIDGAWVDNNGVKTVLFWSNGCAVGNLEYADNFLASILYSPASTVLVAKGTTNDSGGMGNNQNGFFGHNIAVALANGRSVGEAMLDHVNVPLIPPWSDSREFHFGTAIILGDPTLRLRP
jgi:hypothetical protein